VYVKKRSKLIVDKIKSLTYAPEMYSLCICVTIWAVAFCNGKYANFFHYKSKNKQANTQVILKIPKDCIGLLA